MASSHCSVVPGSIVTRSLPSIQSLESASSVFNTGYPACAGCRLIRELYLSFSNTFQKRPGAYKTALRDSTASFQISFSKSPVRATRRDHDDRLPTITYHCRRSDRHPGSGRRRPEWVETSPARPPSRPRWSPVAGAGAPVLPASRSAVSVADRR